MNVPEPISFAHALEILELEDELVADDEHHASEHGHVFWVSQRRPLGLELEL